MFSFSPTWQPLFNFYTRVKKSIEDVYSLGTFFDPFLNISNLTLNFKSLTSYRRGNKNLYGFDHCEPGSFGFHDKQTSMLIGFYVVYPLVTQFTKLTKLSILLQNKNMMRAWSETGRPWWTADQDQIVEHFENSTLEVVTAALGVNPKLCGVRTSSLIRRMDTFTEDGFAPMSCSRYVNRRDKYEPLSGYVHDVEWFWQAEENKTLVWDMEKADDQAEKFGLEIKGRENKR